MISIKNAIVIFLVLFTFTLKAQDFPYHYFSHINPLLNNPSLAAFNSKISVDVAAHNLWAGGFKPLNDYMISFSFAPNGKKLKRKTAYQPNVGLGLVFLNEQIGPFNQNILQIIYAYHIPIDQKTMLSLGISGMVENIGINVNSLSPLEENDPRLLTGNNNSFLIDGGFGATVHAEKYRISISALNLAPGIYRFNDASIEDITNYRKFYFTGSYTFEINDKMRFQPEITVRNSRLKSINYDTSISCDFAHILFGLGYRSENSFFVFTKIPFREFIFTYTSENPLNSNHMIGNGHTLSVGWVPY